MAPLHRPGRFPHRWFCRIQSLLLAFMASGCARQVADVQRGVGEDGVTEVRNYAEEPYAEAWQIELVGSIGVAYGDEDYMLSRPWFLTVFEDGTAVILDSNPLRFRIYDSDGGFMRNIAQQGDGPTDIKFSGPHATVLRPAEPDRFAYLFGRPLRRQVWGLDGRLRETETMSDRHPLVQTGRPRMLGLLGDRIYAFYTYQGRSESDTRGHHEFWTGDWNGQQVELLFTVPAFDWEGLGELSQAVGMAQAVSDYTPEEKLLVTGDGRIYYSGMDEDWIHAFDAGTGHEALRFRLVHEIPVAITASEAETARERFGRSIGDGMDWLSRNFWLQALVEGPGEEIWVQRTGGANADGVWPTDVFLADGSYQGRLMLPFAPYLMRVRGNLAYAAATGQEGQPVVAWYRLTR